MRGADFLARTYFQPDWFFHQPWHLIRIGYDFFVFYVHGDNREGRITRVIGQVNAARREFAGVSAAYSFFFDTNDITHGTDWQLILSEGIALSRANGLARSSGRFGFTA